MGQASENKMPEGDTIFRSAAKLGQSLEGCVIREATTTSLTLQTDSLIGQTIVNIAARGKHLLMHLSNTQIIHSHMGMTGSWHTYRRNHSWHKPASQAVLALYFDNAVAVCYSPKLLELLTAAELKRHRWLARLGPDLLAQEFDVAEALTRFRRRNELPMGEAPMNQSIVSGIGNVYKSELLYLDQTHPLTFVTDTSDETLTNIITRARKLLRRNVLGGPRRTRFRGDGHTLWVYGRQGEPCLKCGAMIHLTRQGDLGRTTYFCPSCQVLERH